FSNTCRGSDAMASELRRTQAHTAPSWSAAASVTAAPDHEPAADRSAPMFGSARLIPDFAASAGADFVRPNTRPRNEGMYKAYPEMIGRRSIPARLGFFG